MIKIKRIEDIEANEGDYISTQIVKTGEPHKVTVIPKQIIEDVKDCMKQYVDDNQFMSDIDNHSNDDQLQWVLGIIRDTAIGTNSVKVYEVEKYV